MTHRLRLAVIAGCVLGLAGCGDPNFIGVQDYGSIYGNAISTTNAPIARAYVSATGTTAVTTTGADGSFNLANVAVGEQTVTISAPGYATATTTVVVVKGMPVNAGNVALTATTSTPVSR